MTFFGLDRVLRSSEKEQMVLFRTLAALLASRVPLVEALDECIGHVDSAASRGWLKRVRDAVNAGDSFSSALAAQSAVPPLVGALVRTAESTGTLPAALQEAADVMELRIERSQSLVAALTYPAVVMGVTMIAAVFLATVITPRVAYMYRQTGHELPWLTRTVGAAGYIVAGVMALGGLAMIVFRLLPARRNRAMPDKPFSALQLLINKAPLVKHLRDAHQTALWTQCLNILLSHGINLNDALMLAAQTASDATTATELLEARRQILSGESPGAAFSTIKTAPALARRLLSGGDAAGNLADACARVHHIYDAEYRQRMKRLMVLAEPLAVVIAGCFVILVALAVLLPIANLGGLL